MYSLHFNSSSREMKMMLFSFFDKLQSIGKELRYKGDILPYKQHFVYFFFFFCAQCTLRHEGKQATIIRQSIELMYRRSMHSQKKKTDLPCYYEDRNQRQKNYLRMHSQTMGNDSITFFIHNSYLSASDMPLVLLSFQKYIYIYIYIWIQLAWSTSSCTANITNVKVFLQ